MTNLFFICGENKVPKTSCMSRIKTHFSARALGGKSPPGRYNKSTVVSAFQDKHEHLSSEISSPKFHQKMTLASPVSRRIIGL